MTKTITSARWLCVLLLLAAWMSASRPALATGILVATGADADVSDSKCSLREAITAANTDAAYKDCAAGSGADTITFSFNGTVTLGSALPDITDSDGLTIDGGDTVKVSGDDRYRVFQVASGAILTLQNLVVMKGYAASGGSSDGGGVRSLGRLTIADCTFSGNRAVSGGGAIYLDAGYSEPSVISATTFLQNGALENGGAIKHLDGPLRVQNCTFAGNSAGGVGGGFALVGPASVDTYNNTFWGNSAALGGGAMYRADGTLNVGNTIVASNTTTNCGGTINNQGRNIDDGSSCGWGSDDGSMSNTAPRLGDLGYYGGGTQTIPLMFGSPALDAIPNLSYNCPSVDQRGETRPFDGDGDGTADCDAGAFEEQEGWTLDESLFLPTTIKQ